MAEKTGGNIEDVKLMKLERFVIQKRLKPGFELGNELVDYFSDKGLSSKLCTARLYLSQIHYHSKEYFRSLSELNKCLEIITELQHLEISVKIAMAEASLQAFNSPLISLNLLNSIILIMSPL